jgi:hypothetical protein
MQDSVKDAWYLGYKIPFSQSLKDFKESYSGRGVWVKELVVDELRSFASKGSAVNRNASAQQASALNTSTPTATEFRPPDRKWQ